MIASKKRTFSQFNEDQGDYEECGSNTKKQKTEKSLNIDLSPSAMEEREDTTSSDSIESKENIEYTLNNNDCIIVEHRLKNEWYNFKVIKKSNCSHYEWLKHKQLKHLNIYDSYLKANNLAIDDVKNPQYIPETITDHQYDKTNDEMLFLVKWKGYSHEDDTWEPHQMLIDNQVYVEYCKQNGIEYIDIESEYNSAKNHEKPYDIESINDIINAIDCKTQTNKISAIRQYFQTLKEEFRKNESRCLQNSHNKNHNIKQYDDNDNENKLNNNDSNNNKLPLDKEDDHELPIKYLSQTTTCSLCKRKWKLCSIEFFKVFPICNSCPRHIRLGYDRECKEDWFCPYCIHYAKCKLFSMINDENECNSHFGTNGVSLKIICALKDKPYLYVKRGLNWNTYLLLKVIDEKTGHLMVQHVYARSNTKKKKKKKNVNKNIILSDIESKHILWAFVDKNQRQIATSKIKKVIALRHENDIDSVLITLTTNTSQQVAVKRAEIINCTQYFVKLCCETSNQHHSNKQPFDNCKIFKYSRYLREEKLQQQRKKNKFGANTIIKEYAALNSRFFNEHKENENEEIIPNYPNTTNALLSDCNYSGSNVNLLKPPQRTLLLADIMPYSLTLIVGASGSGKTTLLRSIQSQNASIITFKNPSDLLWDNNKCIISEFSDVSIEMAMNNMSSIGLNNIRTWLKPFNVLSAGEQYRCGFARLLKESQVQNETNKIILMDEFTSVLDRSNARCMAAAISKCIRKNNKNGKQSNFILASANADIIRYLQPDLLILLGENNEMKLIENPNNLNDIKSLFDVKAVLDLPQFALRKEDRNMDDYKSIDSIKSLTTFNDLKAIANNVVENEVCELKCKVLMDDHAKNTSIILDIEEFNGETITHIPCLEKQHIFYKRNSFNIGIIYGPSGSGKTTSGIKLFGKPKDILWDNERNIASHFADINNFKELLFTVNLSLNIGLAKYNYLSQGEKHRINICRLLQDNENGNENATIIDEFTSYLDRVTAKKMAKRISNYIYKYNKKNIVFLCCKYDIISSQNGLFPSWVFDVVNKRITYYKSPSSNINENIYNENVVIKKRKHAFFDITNLWNAPRIRLILKNAERSDWSLFAKYHYMESSILSSAKCYSVWAYFSYFNNEEDNDGNDENDSYYNENELELVGFISILNYFGKPSQSSIKFDFREHRTVILPSFQGLGFGSRIADCMAEYLCLHGLRMHSKTAHPRYGGYRDLIPSLWIPTKNSGKISSRSQWKEPVVRCLYGNRAKAIGLKKKFYIHVYKLHNDEERGNLENKKLKERVIVAKKYTKINKQ